MSTSIFVPISAGELIDKIVILQIKLLRITDSQKREQVQRELSLLMSVQDRDLAPSPQLSALAAELKSVNEALWEIEDEIRICERTGSFDQRFVELARCVYRTNDRRSDLKLRINQLLGSDLLEAKQYEQYD